MATALDAIVSGGSMMMPLAAARGAAPVLKTTERPSRFGRWIVAVSAASLFLVLGSWANHVVTDNGTLKIDSKVDDVKIEVTQNGKHVAFYDQKQTARSCDDLPAITRSSFRATRTTCRSSRASSR